MDEFGCKSPSSFRFVTTRKKNRRKKKQIRKISSAIFEDEIQSRIYVRKSMSFYVNNIYYHSENDQRLHRIGIGERNLTTQYLNM